MQPARLNCPQCNYSKTLESLLREVAALAKQADKKHYEHAEIDLERGLVNYGPPESEDRLEPIRPRMGLVHRELDHIKSTLQTVETCASCGTLYRPEAPRLLRRIEELYAHLQKRHLLDALARADQSEG